MKTNIRTICTIISSCILPLGAYATQDAPVAIDSTMNALDYVLQRPAPAEIRSQTLRRPSFHLYGRRPRMDAPQLASVRSVIRKRLPRGDIHRRLDNSRPRLASRNQRRTPPRTQRLQTVFRSPLTRLHDEPLSPASRRQPLTPFRTGRNHGNRRPGAPPRRSPSYGVWPVPE